MKTVLVIDDEYAIVDALVEAFEAEGYACLRASNGREGLSVMVQRTPDLVIMDVMMPVQDGRATLDEMRRRAHLARVPVILMSAAPRGVALPGTEDDHTRFLKKPFDLDEVLGLAAHLLEGGRS